MALVTAGRDALCAAVVGEAGFVPFNAANAHVAVGNGTAAVAAAQTDLQGASRARKAMDAGYPTRAANVITFRATFGTADALFDWQEVGIMNAPSVGTMLSRFLQAFGVKSNAETKTLTVTFTLTA